MCTTPVTTEELTKELKKHLPQICKELNRNKDITIKKMAAGKILLVSESKQKMN